MTELIAIQVETVILKLSTVCNLKCDYCYIYTFDDTSWKALPKFMEYETFECCLHNLKNLSDTQNTKFDVVLHGGEPLTIGEERFISYIQMARSILSDEICIDLQTNGILLSKVIIDACKKYNVTVSISLDGNDEQTKKHRFDAHGNTRHHTIIQNITTANNNNVLGGILSVIDVTNNPQEFFDFFSKLNPISLNLILPDGNYVHIPPAKDKDLGNTKYGKWLAKLFDFYFTQDKIKIVFFDKILQQILVRKEDIKLPSKTYRGFILTIESNGKIKGNDVLRTTKVGLDSLGDHYIESFDLRKLVHLQEVQIIDNLTYTLPEQCKHCTIADMCEGGYISHRFDGKSFNNPSVYCDDLLYLYTHIEKAVNDHLSSY